MSNAKKTEHVTQAGNVLFMALATPTGRTNYKTGQAEINPNTNQQYQDYAIQLEFDGSNPEHAELRNLLTGVNSLIPSTKNVSAPGCFKVKFSAKERAKFQAKQPLIVDGQGNKLDPQTLSRFSVKHGDNATARVGFEILDYGDTKIMTLTDVQILSLNISEKEDLTQERQSIFARSDQLEGKSNNG